MKIIRCDRCNKDLYFHSPDVRYITTNDTSGRMEISNKEIEICITCFQKLQKFLKKEAPFND